MVHSGLVQQDDDLLNPESNIRPEQSQQVLDQASKVTLVLTPVHKDPLPPGVLQHILGPCSEELFDDPPRRSRLLRN